ncbi:hypothetical protein ACS0TY_028201 [Phlomoides rotata]
MNEYGMEKSWEKKFVMTRLCEFGDSAQVVPIKVFKDSDILLSCERCSTDLFYYSTKNKTNRKIYIVVLVDLFDSNNMSGVSTCYISTHHISSFLSLKCFVMENSISYILMFYILECVFFFFFWM